MTLLFNVSNKRKNQSSLEDKDWMDLIDAINKLHDDDNTNWGDFVKIHVNAMRTHDGHAWGVHTMRQMDLVGRNFLACHREYLLYMEERLRSFSSSVTLPYWDWTKDKVIPQALSKTSDLDRWDVYREPILSLLPNASQVDPVMKLNEFSSFQDQLESIHNNPHRAVGGDMVTAESPKDPLFWLHHANIDRLWSIWQASDAGKNPDNEDEQLQPGPIITHKVKDLLDIENLGYHYE